MNIIIDAMGGDNAPKEILLGAAAAVREYGVQITAVGRRRDIEACARENGIDMAGITVADAAETIEMCDEPTAAIRGKKDSSMVVGLRMLAAGEGDAFVSAGSTGARRISSMRSTATKLLPASDRMRPSWRMGHRSLPT